MLFREYSIMYKCMFYKLLDKRIKILITNITNLNLNYS